MKEMEGAADVLMVADPTTFRVLPWAPATGWVLCDLYFNDGRPVPFATRALVPQGARSSSASRGYDFVAGLEVEFHIFKLDDAHMRAEDAGQPGTPPSVSLLSHGYQYLTEQRFDQMEPVLEILRRDIIALGLPLRSVEVEFGPSQCELTFPPKKGLEPADNMVLFRSAIKQIARRHGYHASFMCRPKLQNLFASGWHLHQSIVSRATGENLFMRSKGRAAQRVRPRLSRRPARPRPRRDRVHDADHQRLQALPLLFAGARSRDLGPRQSRRDDPRAGRRGRSRHAAGKPRRRARRQSLSLHGLAGSVGLDGVDRKLDPGPSADTPYETKAPLLPKSLRDAVAALKDDPFFREKLGAGFIDYYTHIKNAEIDRFLVRGDRLGAPRIF